MWKDPIVEEVRAAGRKIVEREGNDLHKLCEALRKSAAKHRRKLVRRQPTVAGGTRTR